MCSICLAMQEESRGDRSLRGRRPSVTQTVAAICRTCLGEKGDASALNVVRMNNRDVLARLSNNQAIRAENNNDLHRALRSIRGLPRSRRVRLMLGKSLRVCSCHSTMLQVPRQACSPCQKSRPTRNRAIVSWMHLKRLARADLYSAHRPSDPPTAWKMHSRREVSSINIFLGSNL